MPIGKILRRFLWRLIIIIVVCCVSVYGYVQYQRNISYQTPISKNASRIIRVDVYGIYKSMILDFFSRKKSKRESMFRGISIPANIFIYTLKGKQSTTLLASFPVKNKADMEASLKEQGQWINVGKVMPGISVATTADKTWTVVYNDRRIAFAWSLHQEKVQEALLEIVQEQNTIAVANSPFKTVQEQEGHITFQSGENKGSLDFGRGNIKAFMSLAAKDYRIPQTAEHLETGSGDAIHLWLYADLQPLLQGKIYAGDSMQISGDSLLACHPGGLELAVTQPVTQREEVVTYTYNDDFEKIATTTIQEHTVPGIYAWLKADVQSLSGYFKKQGIISKDSGVVRKSLFPLYQLYAAGSQEYLQFSTLREISGERKKVKDAFFLGVMINFGKLLQQQEFSVIHKYMKPFTLLELRGRKDQGQHVSLEGTLYFTDSHKHALLQLLNLL